MKNILFCLALLTNLSATQLSAITNYQAGDKLYVHAANGLVLRDKPDPNGQKRTTIAVGEQVTVLKEDLKSKPYATSEFKGYEIKGFWVKVSYGKDQTGYVFDGYLSKYKAPSRIEPKGAQADYTLPEQYLLAHTKVKGKRIELPKPNNQYGHYRQRFENGAEVEANMGEGGSQYILKFDKFTSLEEGYLIAKSLWFSGTTVQKSTFAKGKITLSDAGDTLLAVIEQKGGIVELTLSHAD
jgi:hypothetical protein